MNIHGRIAEYTIFFVIYVTFTVLFYLFRHDVDKLRIVALAGTSFYVFWGVIHQLSLGRGSLVTILEYFFIGGFAYLIMLLALSY